MILESISRAIRTQNWFAVAVEFVLVVAGVVIGFQINAWNEARSLERQETEILTQIRTSVEADLESVKAQLERFRRADAALADLLAHVESRQPYEPALDRAFGLMYGFGSINLDRAGYESLKSQGVALIRDPGMRRQIISLYERTYAQLDKSMDGELDVVLYLRPFFLENFRNLVFTRSATPIDYQRLLDDVRLPNLIDYRLQTIRLNQLRRFGESVEEMSALVEVLAAKLGAG